MVLVQFPTTKVNAFPGNYYWYPDNMHVRIFHPASGKCLGIDRNGNEVNGARLQLQRYEEGNQNQIFYLKAVSKDLYGHVQYQIRIHGENGKIIEVRNGSRADWGAVGQWSEHMNPCAKWLFFTQYRTGIRSSATCCIKNVNSGKLLNVANGSHRDGNNIIQYHEDGTSSEVFQIRPVGNQVAGAVWSRDWSTVNCLLWSMRDNTKANRRSFNCPISEYSNGKIKYPQTFQREESYLAAVIWLNSNLQKKYILSKDIPKSAWDQIKEAVGDFAREQVVDRFFPAIPTSDITGIVGIIATAQERDEWYKFKRACQVNDCVRIEVYYTIKSGYYGVNWKSYVKVDKNNPAKNTYWNGQKSSVATSTVVDQWGNRASGSTEFFYK